MSALQLRTAHPILRVGCFAYCSVTGCEAAGIARCWRWCRGSRRGRRLYAVGRTTINVGEQVVTGRTQPANADKQRREAHDHYAEHGIPIDLLDAFAGGYGLSPGCQKCKNSLRGWVTNGNPRLRRPLTRDCAELGGEFGGARGALDSNRVSSLSHRKDTLTLRASDIQRHRSTGFVRTREVACEEVGRKVILTHLRVQRKRRSGILLALPLAA